MHVKHVNDIDQRWHGTGTPFFLCPRGRSPCWAAECFPLTPAAASSRDPLAAGTSVDTYLPSLAELLSCGQVFPKILPSEMAISGVVPGSAVSFPSKAFFPPLLPPPALCQAGTHKLPTAYRVCWALEAQGGGRLLPGRFQEQEACGSPHDRLASATLWSPRGGGGRLWGTTAVRRSHPQRASLAAVGLRRAGRPQPCLGVRAADEAPAVPLPLLPVGQTTLSTTAALLVLLSGPEPGPDAGKVACPDEGRCRPPQGRARAHDLSFRTKSCVGFLGLLAFQGTTAGEALCPEPLALLT